MDNLLPLSFQSLHESDLGILLLNCDLHVVFANGWMRQKSRWPPEIDLQKPISELFDQPLPKRLLTAIDAAAHKGRSSILSQKLNKSPFPIYRNDQDFERDERILQMIFVKPLVNEGSTYIFLQIFDVSDAATRELKLIETSNEAKQANVKLKVEQERSKAILDGAKDCIIALSGDGRIVSANAYSEHVLGFTTNELLQKNALDIIVHDWQMKVSQVEGLLEQWKHFDDSVELEAKKKDREIIPIELTVNQYEIEGSKQYVAIIRDVSAKKRAERKLQYLAQYDVLTGLANRALFNERLSDAMKTAERNSQQMALYFIDLDRFKILNDTLGHEFGDNVLRETAVRLKGVLRKSDLVARLGGDEFVVLIERNIDQFYADQLATKIIESFEQDFVIDKYEVRITVSVGIAMYPENGETHTDLVRNADTAMYRAKNEGKSNYLFFSAEMNQKVERWHLLEINLRRAILESQFVLHFQPQINTKTMELHGAEALVRWIHPDEGMVSPGEFIPIAESTGLIWEIGQIVFQKACEFAIELKQQKIEALVAINLSPKQFNNPELYDWLMSTCDKNSVEPAWLELEITEGVLMENIDRAIEIIRKLHEAGFSISVDDFGTGYSSLSYLRQFDLDTLKVDQSFVQDLPDDQDAIAITKAIVSLAHSLRLQVVAEGVETMSQSDFLRFIGCEYLQGYYYSRPVPQDEFIAWYEKYRARKLQFGQKAQKS